MPAPNNVPGARGWGAVSWTDHQGHLWLHGGIGFDRNGVRGRLDDMWMYDIATNEWTWMKGADTINSPAVYGSPGVAATSNTRGSTNECNTAWVKSDGSLWTFGGNGTLGYTNDMWKFDIGTNNWIWMSGPQGANSAGSYGIKNVETATNLPPSRGTYTRWQDPQDNFYIFGGYNYSSSRLSSVTNDVWRYNSNNNLWTWIAGSDSINAPGQYTSYCLQTQGAQPSARYENRTAQTNNCSNVFWTFGGFTNANSINDLWNFNTQTNEWTWVSGSNASGSPGSYGTINVPAAGNVPPARAGVCLWIDSKGQLWMWGGRTGSDDYSDMWRFVPDTACIHTRLTVIPLNVSLTDTDLCHHSYALVKVDGGYIVSYSPHTGIVLSDSSHLGFRPSTATTYTVVVWGYCKGFDTLSYTIPAAYSSVTSLQQRICLGDSLNFNGQIIKWSGFYTDTFLNSRGCDSFVTLNLTTDTPIQTTINQYICLGKKIFFHGDSLYISGVYTDTLQTMTGCDSIVHFSLIVIPVQYTYFHLPICKGTSIMIHGQTIDTAISFTDTLTNFIGCDSFLITEVHVIDFVYDTIYRLICQGGTTIYNRDTISKQGSYYDTVHIMGPGCDTIHVLILYVNSPPFSITTVEICLQDSFWYKGRYLTMSGQYLDTVKTPSGCDSIVALNLLKVPFWMQTDSQSICQGQSYIFRGIALTASGTYFDTVHNPGGCDSFFTLNLTVFPTSTTSVSQYLCQGNIVSFNGDTFSTAGTHIYRYTNRNGCDSTVTLSLAVLSSPSDTIRDTVCSGERIFFSGVSYSKPGVYRDTFLNPEGCDSIMTFILTVLPNPTARFLISPPTDPIELGTTVTVTDQSLNADTVIWRLNDHASALVSGGTVPMPDTGTYCIRLIASTHAGCSDTSTQCIYVFSNAFYMPNAFTPNGDGLNDYIELYGMKTGFKYMNIKIYDRWGEKVFESDDFDFKWDGTFEGEMQEPNVFVYILDLSFLDGHVIHNKGSITLIR